MYETIMVPTVRRTEDDVLDPAEGVPAPELLSQPWIDVHNHAHTLSWADRERYALSGCSGMVMVAAGYHWTPYRPVRARDVRYLWDDAINRRAAIERDHLFSAKLGLGIHTGVAIENPDELVAAMADYCEHEAVVAIGETGVTPAQHVSGWRLDDQRAVIREQCSLAARHDLPLLLHTPIRSGHSGRETRSGMGLTGYEKHPGLDTEPVFEAENPGIRALEENLAAASDAGLPEDRIVASHAGPETIPYLMEETDCYASVTLGHQWLLGVTVEDVRAAIETYGPERLMLDTDCANVLRTDPFAVKRAMLDLYRQGIDVPTIRQVVSENPATVFDFTDA